MATNSSAQKHAVPVVIEDIGNGYFVWCPTLTGVSGNGITYESALQAARSSIQNELSKRAAAGRTSPIRGVSLSFLEVDA